MHRRSASDSPPSILVLTKDEEINIGSCLEHLAFSDDIVVLDSYSSDRTLEIARRFPNVRVVQRKFDTWSKHSNWALENIEFKHPWVYYSDADEHVTPELRDEILSVVNDAARTHVAYRLRYKNMFMNRWLRHGGVYPVWIMRLFKPDKVRYEEREVNAHPLVQGTVGELSQHFIHYSFSKGLAWWFQKHNGYSQMEAHEAIRVRSMPVLTHVKGLLCKDRATRRRSLKNLSFYLPLRGLMRFAYMYLLRLGFMDGVAGFHYALMISTYEYWISLKVAEKQHDWKSKTNRLASKLLMERQAMNSIAAPISPAPIPSAVDTRIDVMIATFNEAEHVTETVQNAKKIGSVFVLDSGSTDGTQQMARDAGATVIEHPFIDYSKQKNWGLDHLPFTGDWVFILDADERLTPALIRNILKATNRNDGIAGYYINRVLIFMGQAIRHGGYFPAWNLRLFKRDRARYEDRSVHEHMVCTGPTAYLPHYMLHIRREPISQYIAKHIRYADMESDEWIKQKLGQSTTARTWRLFQDSLFVRQWTRRNIWPRLRFRALGRFIYMYFFRLGFLDGLAGWHLAWLMANYEYMISLLYDEKREKLRSNPATTSPGSSQGKDG